MQLYTGISTIDGALDGRWLRYGAVCAEHHDDEAARFCELQCNGTPLIWAAQPQTAMMDI